MSEQVLERRKAGDNDSAEILSNEERWQLSEKLGRQRNKK
jgi:hypothetical protein